MGDLDNDMDELFRNAANHYPLKTDGADWDKIIGKLPEAVGTPLPPTQQKENKKNRKLLWLILLFPMGWLCNSYFNGTKNDAKNDAKIILNTSTNKLDSTIQIVDSQNNRIKEKLVKVNIEKNNPSVIKARNNTKPTNEYAVIEKDNGQALVLTSGAESGILDGKKELSVEKDFSNGRKNSMAISTEGDLQNQFFLHNGDVSTNAAETAPAHFNIKPLAENKTQQVDAAEMPKPSNKIDSFQTKNASPKIGGKNKGFYLGAIGGIDASSVKNQGVKKAGYTYGLLIGHHLNKHFAIETGLFWDNKQYYTDGAYFNKSRTTIPSTVAISDMDGSCNMFEVPIDISYNFAQNKKTLFFGTVGLSSYFMKKEYYGYQATANGSTWYAMKTYYNSGNSLFSLIDFGIGYEHKIGEKVSLRINPYLKIPLKGLGIGSLPITSAGVNVGLSIPFHK